MGGRKSTDSGAAQVKRLIPETALAL